MQSVLCCATALISLFTYSTVYWQVKAATKKGAAKLSPAYSTTWPVRINPRIVLGACGQCRYLQSVWCCATALITLFTYSTVFGQVKAATKKEAAKLSPAYSATFPVRINPRIVLGAWGQCRYRQSVLCCATGLIILFTCSTVFGQVMAATKKETSKFLPANWVASAIGINPRVEFGERYHGGTGSTCSSVFRGMVCVFLNMVCILSL